VSLISQTARLAPADQQLYALRNVTATVDSVPLIAASIMSKKLAAGSDGIVLDVKTGQGAFMQKYEDALELARTMVNIGEDAGRRMVALVTAMQQPLGRAIGNAIEVVEAIDTLAGNGPPDLVALVTELGGEMLLMSGVAATREAARAIIAENLANRKGLAKLAELIAAQGGDRSVVDHPDLLPQPRMTLEIPSETSGYVAAIDAFEVGLASRILGAGRTTKDGRIDPSIGIYLNKKIGDSVKTGETLAVLHSDGDNQKIKAARDKFLRAYAIGPDRVEPPKLLLARITGAGAEEL
jgi:pyrimidine-nucleoside phosphorylase